ncbi:MAG: helix-turn-helix transcriptional regulator [Candidatus Solibacter sp.]
MSNSKQERGRRAEGFLARMVEGVVLLDSNDRVLAYDVGAATILEESMHAGSAGESTLHVPQKLLDTLRAPHWQETNSRKVRVELGEHVYSCRIHVTRSRPDTFPGPVTVLYLTREANITDAVSVISAEYRLTVREQQALRGVLTGLTSKQVAQQMNISPNTVKAFLRLIMGKMGVSSRTGIVAKLFDSNGHDR